MTNQDLINLLSTYPPNEELVFTCNITSHRSTDFCGDGDITTKLHTNYTFVREEPVDDEEVNEDGEVEYGPRLEICIGGESTSND